MGNGNECCVSALNQTHTFCENLRGLREKWII